MEELYISYGRGIFHGKVIDFPRKDDAFSTQNVYVFIEEVYIFTVYTFSTKSCTSSTEEINIFCARGIHFLRTGVHYVARGAHFLQKWYEVSLDRYFVRISYTFSTKQPYMSTKTLQNFLPALYISSLYLIHFHGTVIHILRNSIRFPGKCCTMHPYRRNL